jgi:hypothetical protein
MSRDDHNWLAKQQADNHPPGHSEPAMILATIGFLLLFWCAACAWTIRLLEVARA